MVWMNQQKKAELAPAIKSVLKKYGMKGTISVNNNSTLVVNLNSGKLDILGNWFESNKDKPDYNRWEPLKKPDYLQVNNYYINEHFTGEVKDFLNELHAAMKGDDWFDKSDIQSDYFHVAWYIDINVGKWDKPYECV